MDSETKTISARLYADVGCLPTELCRLIASYTVRRRHTWNASTSNLPAGAATVQTTDDGTTILSGYESADKPWRMFVSESTFADGQLAWTVEIDILTEHYPTGWIGFGVTGAFVENGTCSGLAFDRANNDGGSWIVHPMNDNMAVWQGSRRRLVWFWTSLAGNGEQSVRLRAWLTADPRTGIIRARLHRNNGRWIRDVDRLDSSVGRLSFDRLRPCVVISGARTAVVRSGSSSAAAADDCPSDATAFDLLQADVSDGSDGLHTTESSP